ncbi:hypothetical protein HFU84_08530 [Acidithiobacillus sp. CV18-2]|nr:hypothetical protein [Acidithiobacillus sp. CV18-3]MBU2756937.1 hypothetical protein [Acidithiobacillus sp. BN09-2]MBU2777548.1 hypothetical protein [Acidithiobacillus sp. CV18-2]MBU2799648.1 hypothetical protein [Acidithiobacillus sp. VAN18-4]
MDRENTPDMQEQDHKREDSVSDEMEDEEIQSHLLSMLHLPPGLDLLFELLDSGNKNTVAPAAPQPITPVPYPRTPTLG